MEKTFYSNGKLLLTGEYVVLDGALALALPTKYGQSLFVKEGTGKKISWKSHDADGSLWYEDTIQFNEILSNSNHESTDSVRKTLLEILREAYLLNTDFIDNSDGYSVTTKLTFPKEWGLGTSSTLINNIAQWLHIDAFALLKNSFGGSGYDIACAQNHTPILYHISHKIPVVDPVGFDPAFKDKLYFVYLNRKQSSKAAIETYKKARKGTIQGFDTISQITQKVLHATSLTDFEALLSAHETAMGKLLDITPVKQDLFPDFDGFVKSLGAWGGDFVLVASDENPTDYFKQKGYHTIIPYHEMIL
ncbi:MAG: GHMP kinase [Flavobacterium sp. BFFFF1]|uniref:GYDIA family GHMP kinase n=1 Tax=Flavobacterium sp. BFFFF1 TaxID=2015557 RepID=UPI000BC44055|nr:GYDIA family GHMP kinase [Flavobacterium sp. BFFFF1]OYU82173.1 MAG: GHMP kinase [Flavobacterium sp. BFFFF1]